jgi:hypothetical protein
MWLHVIFNKLPDICITDTAAVISTGKKQNEI